MKLMFCKELYPKSALLKAAFSFTDRAYILLDANDTHYIVTIEMKGKDVSITEQDFINELLGQTVRYDIYKKTKVIRELLLARSLASTVIETSDYEYIEDSENQYNADDILKDWFKNEDFT